RLAERRLGPGLVPVRVAVGIEQALTRGQDRSGPVVIDRPALQYEVVAPESGARMAGDLFGHLLVALQDVLAAPAVEAEAGGVGAVQEDRPGVPKPYVAEAAGDDLDALRGADQPARDLLSLRGGRHQPHPLASGTGERTGQGGDLGLRLLEV